MLQRFDRDVIQELSPDAFQDEFAMSSGQYLSKMGADAFFEPNVQEAKQSKWLAAQN